MLHIRSDMHKKTDTAKRAMPVEKTPFTKEFAVQERDADISAAQDELSAFAILTNLIVRSLLLKYILYNNTYSPISQDIF